MNFPDIQFETSYRKIFEKLGDLDPMSYGKTRNYIHGNVSYLSPYISRGVLSTRMVFEHLQEREIGVEQAEKFIQELAWRDFWQRKWQKQKTEIDRSEVILQMPAPILNGNTGIEAIDQGIQHLYKTGYMHNHLRMYVAAITCNYYQSHWLAPALWMHAHLLDADWGSNAFSWQWVAGVNRSKKYIANQENINTYCKTNQSGTLIDCSYEELETLSAPSGSFEMVPLTLKNPAQQTNSLNINDALDTCIYTPYNLDPNWRNSAEMNRVLLLDSQLLTAYPMGENTLNFLLELGKNIANLQVFFGDYESLRKNNTLNTTYSKEHPLFDYPIDVVDDRDWLSKEDLPFKSFFKFWKHLKKELV